MTRRAAAGAVLAALAVLVCAPAGARGRTHFTSELKDATDQVLIDAFGKAEARARAGRKGTIDVLVFSFTTRALADEILRIADAWPDLVDVLSRKTSSNCSGLAARARCRFSTVS